uniref:Uncharacterized protein n=1 Tax=viral metagenome TaxID=1070528 RepID=A0A6M3M2D4_9ZZZZ
MKRVDLSIRDRMIRAMSYLDTSWEKYSFLSDPNKLFFTVKIPVIGYILNNLHKLKHVNYPPTAEPMGWASGVITPSNLGSSS